MFAGHKPSHDYKAYLAKRTRQGHYFPKFLDYCKAFSPSQSDLLLHLINFGKVRADQNGWIMATPQFLQNGLGLSTEEQAEVIARLEERGVLDVQVRPTGRYLRPNIVAIERSIKGDHEPCERSQGQSERHPHTWSSQGS